MKQYELFDEFNDRLQIRKDKLEKMGIDEELVRQCAAKESPKMFTKIDSKKLLGLVANNVQYKKRSLREKIFAQIDHLGYIDIVGDSYSGLACVVSLDTKYSPRLKLYSLKNGTTLDCKIDKRTFNKDKLKVGDIIKVISNKSKPKMKRDENGNFTPIEGTSELWVTNYKKQML